MENGSTRLAVAALVLAVATLILAGSLRAGAPPSHADARRVLVSAGCAKCHDSVISKESPGALAVYDLQEARWTAQMSDEQLPKLLGRLKSAPARDRELVRAFVDAELQRRRAGN